MAYGKDGMMSQAMSKTMGDVGGDTKDPMPAPADETQPADGTVTIPTGTLPPDVQEGDIVQFEYVTETPEGCVLKLVESGSKPSEPNAGPKPKIGLDAAIGAAMSKGSGTLGQKPIV
jgi:hypothetical protein